MAAKPRKSRARKQPSLPQVPTGLAPTEHTMRQHSYEVIRVEQNGPKVAKNTNGSPLQALKKSGAISKAQLEAGEHFEAARGLVFGGSGTNSIAVMVELGIRLPGGPIENTIAIKQWAERKVDEVRQQCHPLAYSALVDAACLGKYFGYREGQMNAYLRLCEGLDVCAEVFGVGEYEDD